MRRAAARQQRQTQQVACLLPAVMLRLPHSTSLPVRCRLALCVCSCTHASVVGRSVVTCLGQTQSTPPAKEKENRRSKGVTLRPQTAGRQPTRQHDMTHERATRRTAACPTHAALKVRSAVRSPQQQAMSCAARFAYSHTHSVACQPLERETCANRRGQPYS